MSSFYNHRAIRLSGELSRFQEEDEAFIRASETS